MIGKLERQIVYEDDPGSTKFAGTTYTFNSRGKEVRLKDIYEALKLHHKQLPHSEKKMIRDILLMLSDGAEIDLKTPEGRSELLKFTSGFLFGKYTVNTDMRITASNAAIYHSDFDEDEEDNEEEDGYYE